MIETDWDEVLEADRRMEGGDLVEDGCSRCERGTGRPCWWHFA